MVLEKTLESPLDCREIKPVKPKGNQSWISLEGLMLKLKLQYFGYLMWRTQSLEKTLMLGKIVGRRRRDYRGWNGWMAPPTQWTWVLASFRSSWWREAWHAAVHGVTNNRIWLSNWTELNLLEFKVQHLRREAAKVSGIETEMELQTCDSWTECDL